MKTPKIALRFAKRLKQLRQKHALTQEEMAERLDFTPRRYQYLESKKKPKDVRLSTVEKVADALGIPPWQLMKFKK